MARLVEGLREAVGAPGLAVAIADSAGVAVFVSGTAVLEHDVRVDAGTRFRLASTSKAVTAVALAALWDRGGIALDRPASAYLPDLPPHLGAVTPRQLAGHLAGIRGYESRDTIHDLRRFDSARAALSIFSEDPLLAPPGAAYHYTTFGYTLLGAVMEAAAGLPFEDLLVREVVDPLGLESLVIDDPRRLVPGRTSFYERAPSGALRRAPFVDPSYKVAGGGLLSSAADLAKLGYALMDDRLLSDSARDILFEPQWTAAGEPTGVALGWRVGRDPFGRTVRHHEGSMAGARSALLVYPDERVAIAVLSNLGTTPFFAFETAAALAAAARSSARDDACLAPFDGEWAGTATLDDFSVKARLRWEAEGGRAGGVLELGQFPLPVARNIPVLAAWCHGDDVVLVLATGPNWGLIPITLSLTAKGLQGTVALQGNHSFGLRVAR